MNKLESFMQIYMYELELFLKGSKEELLNVSFQSDEANTDRPLKEYLKQKIENEFNKIPTSITIRTLVDIEGNNINITKDFFDIYINRVLLPEEITESIKINLPKKSNTVKTSPDICFEIKYKDTFYYEKIELKSTKNDSIPGSSVQQINPNEWVIFVKHKNNNIEVTTGQYINALNSKMQFPDRSPRPNVAFNTLVNWNKENRINYNDTLTYKNDNDRTLRESLINDWQNVLADNWVEFLFNYPKTKKDRKWFDTNMRKFILKFLTRYEVLTPDEKSKFKEDLSE